MNRRFCLTLLTLLLVVAVGAATAPSLGARHGRAQAAAASATAQSPVTATTPAGPVGNVQNGKRLYVRDGCWQCHGYAGQGGRAVPDTVPLAGTTLSFAAFVKYVRQPDGAMPAYTDKVISDQELADVYAHVKTFAGPRPAAEIPLLKDLSR